MLTLATKYREILPEECNDLNLAGSLYAGLVIARVVSHELDKPKQSEIIWMQLHKRKKPTHDPLKGARSEVLAMCERLRATLAKTGVAVPSIDDVAQALESFEMMSESELACCKGQISKVLFG